MKKILKGVRKKMTEKVEACKIVLSDKQSRLILGLLIFGAGVGIGGSLIASAYITVS